MAIICPAKYKQMEFHKYGVDDETGEIWSMRLNRVLKGEIVKGYPMVDIIDDRFPDRRYQANNKTRKRNRRKLGKHTLVAHTLFETPIPGGVTEEEWDQTPDSVKKACIDIFIVNHKNHNKMDHRPCNLELITQAANIQAAMIFHGRWGKLDYGQIAETFDGSVVPNLTVKLCANLEAFFGR